MRPRIRETEVLGSGAVHPVFDGNPEWRVAMRTPDGRLYVIRPITPDDRDGLRRAFHEASAQTRYLRFGLASSTLNEAALTYLTSVDQQDHVAIVATETSPDLKDERGIGVARLVRSKERPDTAEAAVAVIDDMQQKGVGRALLYELARAAMLRGITKLRADVLHANTTMRAILEKLGAKPVVSENSDGLIVYELDLTAAAASSSYQRAEREEDAAR
jgi:GNAT superfamily N-acetyltransferase